MRRASMILGSLSTVCATPLAAAPRIFIASDSTAQTYAADRAPQMGWGQVLGCALDGGVAVENRAIGGRSTKSFIAEGRLDAIAADIRAGDTLLIQFGHNDASTNKPERFVAADGDYRLNLLRYIRVAAMAGAQPVLLTPVARRAFEGTAVSPSFPAYAQVVREVAAATRTPLIDLGALSAAWVARAGPEPSKRYYLHLTPADHAPGFPNGVTDDTHFSEIGARKVADIVAGGLRALNLPVSSHIKASRPALTRSTPLGSDACGAAGTL